MFIVAKKCGGRLDLFHVAVGQFIKIFCFVFPVVTTIPRKWAGFLALGEVYIVEQEAEVAT